ncbi:39S ribosomal protein S30, mitochondrial isoform X1 [Cricetulus griseus]|uniref:28S ribosomal protein S30 n=2 Tax=Cricetulus griseus TaxID=10029 RepID=A0A061IDJ3_CRIGR|nr:39S ribosomal protein S30, mitochondrial isoform X2 [Cricetulus griseus]XP_027268800.2 39S ribosomal protein S30, mitochondrial isoform X1 [Cricetulus griseus]ERE83199.1 28S ribosomal protein S30 [Cricetulus griseus]
MAAARCWQLVPRRGLSLHAAAEASASASKVSDPEVVATPVARYPPIVASMTADSKAARLRRVQRWQAAVHAAPSVDEKVRILTKMQFKKYMVYPQTFALNADRWYQGFTKTVFISGLPPAPAQSRPSLDLAGLRAAVCDCILQEHVYLRRRLRPHLFDRRQALVSPLLDRLVETLVSLLVPLNPALATAALDCKRPVDFYWLRGEECIPAGHRKGRIDALRYQINDKPHNQIRISQQLPEFVPLDYSIPVEIPVMKCKPDKLPLFKRQYENTIFTGSKTADPCCYGHTQFHLLPDRLNRDKLIKQNQTEQVEVVCRANALASLFAWTGAQAMYQGFWSEADVTRPFVSQGVITDGKYFSFFCYQLNTLALTVQADQNNSRKNICWGTQSKPLYETVEDNDVKGFDDNVLLQIVDFLLNKPKEDRTQLLGSQEKALDLGP